jgi:KilA-N domain
MEKHQINVQGLTIAIEKNENGDYISLTDIAKQSERKAGLIIIDWLRNRSTLRFLETWELRHNPSFKVMQMRNFKEQVDDTRLDITPQRFIEDTGAIGMTSKAGRYGGTFAHQHIALNFCYWISPEFQVYFIEEFERLKEDEAERLGLSWNLRRELSKANYPIHTDAVRENLVPQLEWNTKRESLQFANEADLLNLAVFGMTAKQWRETNPNAKGNIRDAATEVQLQVLANMESTNATLISMGFNKEERFASLSQRADREMEILKASKATAEVKKLK